MHNLQEPTQLHFLWDEPSIEHAVNRFTNLILNKNLDQFSLTLELHLEDYQLDDLEAWKNLIDNFFKTHGQNCQSLSIIIDCFNEHIYHIIFSKFRYLSELKNLEFVFCNADDNSFQFRILGQHILELPYPERITELNLYLLNTITNDADHELNDAENNLINFISRCHSLKKIDVEGNYISIHFYQHLNNALINLDHLENVSLEYRMPIQI